MSGTGGGFRGIAPRQIRAWIEEAEHNVVNIENDTAINTRLADLLAQYNDRDVDLVRSRLEDMQDALKDALETTIDLRFGGSVAKHTYVDGLSDVDSLAVLRDPNLDSLSAEQVLDSFAETLKRELGYEVHVSEGQLAVTVVYPDNMKIQLLPAVKTATGVRIPAGFGNGWSSVIRPQAFAARLTELNQANAGRVIPVIKLAKAALSNLPDDIRPSGYHLESLAIEAFRQYNGPKSYKAMLQHFFQTSSEQVRFPIRDNTGQSVLVDQDLGEANSRRRQNLSGVMDRTARRMSNADRSGSLDDWFQAIGE